MRSRREHLEDHHEPTWREHTPAFGQHQCQILDVSQHVAGEDEPKAPLLCWYLFDRTQPELDKVAMLVRGDQFLTVFVVLANRIDRNRTAAESLGHRHGVLTLSATDVEHGVTGTHSERIDDIEDRSGRSRRERAVQRRHRGVVIPIAVHVFHRHRSGPWITRATHGSEAAGARTDASGLEPATTPVEGVDQTQEIGCSSFVGAVVGVGAVCRAALQRQCPRRVRIYGTVASASTSCQVCGPTMPSTSRRAASWSLRTACSVMGPKIPSALTPSASARSWSTRWRYTTASP